MDFDAKVMSPVGGTEWEAWLFVVLPREVSETLPRRGRTTVEGSLNGTAFRATLEPDGRFGHWLKVDAELAAVAGLKSGDVVRMEVRPVDEEPEPEVPEDLREALDGSPEALEVWNQTTTIARVDWIHWITTAKKEETRAKRIRDAKEMLSAGKKRVCCFDPSGYYSKAFSAPKAAEQSVR